jgi:hypothetical protein
MEHSRTGFVNELERGLMPGKPREALAAEMLNGLLLSMPLRHEEGHPTN